MLPTAGLKPAMLFDLQTLVSEAARLKGRGALFRSGDIKL